jgi:hypothetical protein
MRRSGLSQAEDHLQAWPVRPPARSTGERLLAGADRVPWHQSRASQACVGGVERHTAGPCRSMASEAST